LRSASALRHSFRSAGRTQRRRGTLRLVRCTPCSIPSPERRDRPRLRPSQPPLPAPAKHRVARRMNPVVRCPYSGTTWRAAAAAVVAVSSRVTGTRMTVRGRISCARSARGERRGAGGDGDPRTATRRGATDDPHDARNVNSSGQIMVRSHAGRAGWNTYRRHSRTPSPM
jgi:hypothetical protein